MALKSQYAIYDTEDNLLYVGDSIECSEYLKITREHLYHVISRMKNGIFKCKRYKVFKLEEDDDE